MAFTGKSGHFEVDYATTEDMDPALQQKLLEAIKRALTEGAVSVLFTVKTLSVPRSVPEFWFSVTKDLAPGLCAMAIVSDSLAVRTAASGFSVTNKMRGVKIAVKSFTPSELEAARRWAGETRAAARAR